MICSFVLETLHLALSFRHRLLKTSKNPFLPLARPGTAEADISLVQTPTIQLLQDVASPTGTRGTAPQLILQPVLCMRQSSEACRDALDYDLHMRIQQRKPLQPSILWRHNCDSDSRRQLPRSGSGHSVLKCFSIRKEAGGRKTNNK